MRSVLRVDDRYGLYGDLGGVAAFEYDVRVRVEQERTSRAAKERTPHNLFRVIEHVPAVEFLLQFPFAAWTAKLSVEGFLRLRRWSELVLVPFNQLQSEFGVHLFVDGQSA